MATSLKSGRKINLDNEDNSRNYLLPNLYCKLPTLKILNLSQLESLCLSRLALLKAIGTAKIELEKKYYDVEIIKLLKSFLVRDEELLETKDELSHYLLRIAMSASYDRDWFIQQEALLLRYRLDHITTEELNEFLKNNAGFGWTHITEEEFNLYQKELLYLYDQKLYKKTKKSDNISVPFSKYDFFKVPVQEVSQLVVRKKVLLKNGIAMFAKSELNEAIVDSFKSYLSYALDRNRDKLPEISSHYKDVIDFFNTLPRQTGVMVSTNQGAVKSTDIAKLSLVSFPMCMREMHDALVKVGKLKHEGRLQFSTFLKAIGLPYEDAIVYWKNAFSKTISGTEFDKEYAYNIRHTYGLEGKGISYSPASCAKIIDKVPKASDQVHGCPYRWSTEKLEIRLKEYGLDEFTIIEIVNASKVSPNLACAKYFDNLHKDNIFNIKVNHPNQFYEYSRNYYKMKQELEALKNDKDKDSQ